MKNLLRLMSLFIMFFTLGYSCVTYAQIGLINIQPETFEQANPVAAGYAATLNMNQTALQNEALEQQIELEKQQLANMQQEDQPSNQVKIMIVGTNKYGKPDIYLGCLNCVSSIQDSILNLNGMYGSNKGRVSIFNTHCPYGSPNSNFSVCNNNALHPPMVIDSQGVFYGLITLNTNLPNAIKDPRILIFLNNRVCD